MRRLFHILIITITLAGGAQGQTIKEFGGQVGRDTKDLARFPARWKKHEWIRFAEGAGIVLGAYVFDQQIVDAVSRQDGHLLNEYFRLVTHLGGGYGLDLAAVLAAGGYISHNTTMTSAGVDALESSFAAAGVVTPTIKYVVGRARPVQEEGKHSFHPFDTNFESFPSGHSTNAWAIGTAIATRYQDNRYIPAIAYTLATSVSFARVHDRVHWASDVIAGGMIGHAIAKSITLNHVHAKMVFTPTRDGFVARIRF